MFGVCCLLIVDCWLLHVVDRPSCVGPLFVVRWSLFVVQCLLLFVACRLLFICMCGLLCVEVFFCLRFVCCLSCLLFVCCLCVCCLWELSLVCCLSRVECWALLVLCCLLLFVAC